MRVNTKVVIDIETNAVEYRESFSYDGPVDSCKGDSAAKKQMYDNAAMQKDSYYNFKRVQKNIEDATNKYLQGSGVGFDPQQLAIMRSQFLNQTANQFQDAGSLVRGALAARGSGMGDAPVSGDTVRGLSALGGMRAQSTANGLANIDLADLQQRLGNYWNAINTQNGQAAQFMQGYGIGTSGTNDAMKNYLASKEQGFGAKFMGSLASGLGSGLAKMGTGFLGGFISPQYGGTKGTNGNSGSGN